TPRARVTAAPLPMLCHAGTHVDAPCHFIPGAPAFHEIPLDRLHGPGVVWRVECAPGDTITAEHLARCEPTMRPGDIVLLDAGWAERFGRPDYDDNPALGVDAAEWLVGPGAQPGRSGFRPPELAVALPHPGACRATPAARLRLAGPPRAARPRRAHRGAPPEPPSARRPSHRGDVPGARDRGQRRQPGPGDRAHGLTSLAELLGLPPVPSEGPHTVPCPMERLGGGWTATDAS